MKLTIERIIIAILAIALILGSLFTCKLSKDNKQLKLINYQLDSTVNLRGQTILLQETNVLKTKEEMQQLKDSTDKIFALNKKQEKKIKDIIAYYSSHTVTKIDSVDVPYIDTAERIQWEADVMARCSKIIDYYEANSIIVPKTARDTTKDYVADFTANINGIRINTLSIPDSQYIRFVTLKGGLFKKDQQGKRHLFTPKSIQVQVFHTNPLIHVGDQTTAIYQPPKKKHIFAKVIAFGVGVFIGTKL